MPVDVAPVQAERNIMDAFRGRLARGMAVVSMALGVAGVVAPMAEASAVAHEASAQNDWTNYGGDPLFVGGVHNKKEFKHDVLSPKGQIALFDLGLDKQEVKAVDAATRAGKETLKHFPFGTHFLKMTYGVNGVVVDNQGATFEDPRHRHGFEGYDLKVDLVTHKKIEEKVRGKMIAAEETINDELEIVAPTVCVNISLFGHKIGELAVPILAPPAPETPAPQPAPANTPAPSPTATPVPVTSTPTTPPAAVPPTITFEAAPPAQEQYTDGYTYQDNADVTYPAGDQVLITFGTTNANEGSASTAFQPNSIGSPQEWSTNVTMASGNYIDPTFGIIGTITDETTGLSATVIDTVGTQQMPSLGN